MFHILQDILHVSRNFKILQCISGSFSVLQDTTEFYLRSGSYAKKMFYHKYFNFFKIIQCIINELKGNYWAEALHLCMKVTFMQKLVCEIAKRTT